jgi:hypothetical protein
MPGGQDGGGSIVPQVPIRGGKVAIPLQELAPGQPIVRPVAECGTAWGND